MDKLYVIVRADLSWPQRAVQAGHAVARACLEGVEWRNGTLVYLAVPDEASLRDLYGRLGGYGFFEPYWDDSLTAFAHLGYREEFKHLKLLGK